MTTQKPLGANIVMSDAATRMRKLILRTNLYDSGIKNSSGNTVFDNPGSRILHMTQTTVSEGHRFGRLGLTLEDVGGEFFSSRSGYYTNSPLVSLATIPSAGLYSFYRGKIWPRFGPGTVSLETIEPVTRSTNSQIDAAGSTAISRVIPTNPVAGLAVTFGELHEGFPKMIGSSIFKLGLKKILKGSGDEFLNFQFGILPLINDLRKWHYAYTHADKLWDQFLRDSGRRVRRRYTFPMSQEVVRSDVSDALIQPAVACNNGFYQGGTYHFPLYTEILLKRERWFSGAFTYFAEVSQSQRRTWKDTLRRLDYLYSVKITPQVIWNLAPWSWAADWVTNIGDVVNNTTRFSEDGLVMPYGYMMERSTMQSTYRMRNVGIRSGPTIPDLTEVLTNTVKYRRQATPYGFGVDEQDFSARQWAIIASLGLSRT